MGGTMGRRTDGLELTGSLLTILPVGLLLSLRWGRGRVRRAMPWLPRPLTAVFGLLDLGFGLAMLVAGLRAGDWRPRETGGADPAARLHRCVRHPVYIAVPAVLSGIGWLSGLLGLLLSALLWLPVGLMLAWGEDKRLQGRYTGYSEYLGRTPMLIPDPGTLLRDCRSARRRDDLADPAREA